MRAQAARAQAPTFRVPPAPGPCHPPLTFHRPAAAGPGKQPPSPTARVCPPGEIQILAAIPPPGQAARGLRMAPSVGRHCFVLHLPPHPLWRGFLERLCAQPRVCQSPSVPARPRFILHGPSSHPRDTAGGPHYPQGWASTPTVPRPQRPLSEESGPREPAFQGINRCRCSPCSRRLGGTQLGGGHFFRVPDFRCGYS